MKTETWTLATLNLNGLRAAVKKRLHGWLGESEAQVLCLQELRMQAGQMDAAHSAPPGWVSVQADAEKKGYAGTAVWSNRPVLASSTGCGLDWADREGRLVRADLDVATVVSVYVPSGTTGESRQAMKDAFLEHFIGTMGALFRLGRPVAVCGDVNIAHTERDIHDPKGNKKTSGFLPHEREWMDRLLEQGWVDLYRQRHPGRQEYTWWSNRGGRARELDRGWRIDYLLVTPDLAEKAHECWIVGRDPVLSDHCPVMARFRV